MEPNLKFMILVLLLTAVVACVRVLTAKDKVKALPIFIIPLGIGAFTLLAMECLGSCDTAPVALFNETLHEKLDVPTVDRLIAQARQAPAAGHHH